MEGVRLTQNLMLDLLKIKEITTERQKKNGTRICYLGIIFTIYIRITMDNIYK